jgi:hypothetical protein
MVLHDLIKELNEVNMKKLVFREILSHLQKHMKQDTSDAEFYIPLLPEAALGKIVDKEASVPEYIINEVFLNIESLLEDLEEKSSEYLKKEIK